MIEEFISAVNKFPDLVQRVSDVSYGNNINTLFYRVDVEFDCVIFMTEQGYGDLAPIDRHEIMSGIVDVPNIAYFDSIEELVDNIEYELCAVA